MMSISTRGDDPAINLTFDILTKVHDLHRVFRCHRDAGAYPVTFVFAAFGM
jgi:hypothetical protein